MVENKHYFANNENIIVSKVQNTYMCSILTKGSTCRKNKKMRFLLEQVMTNLLKKN